LNEIEVGIGFFRVNFFSFALFKMWNYEEIGNNLALKMALIDSVYEPTLAQIQCRAEKSVHADEKFKSIPAWKYFAEPFLGLPEHYYSLQRLALASRCIDENITSRDDNDLSLPALPFPMLNRCIYFKLFIQVKARFADWIPSLRQLRNGTIIITSRSFPADIKHNIEIYLQLHNILLPCCFAPRADVIINSPLTSTGRVRCYYVVNPVAIVEATFINAKGRVICRCDYTQTNLHGSSSYQEICEAIKSRNETLNE
jgi:hypothetical protein